MHEVSSIKVPRSNHIEVTLEIASLKNFEQFLQKDLHWSLSLVKLHAAVQ